MVYDDLLGKMSENNIPHLSSNHHGLGTSTFVCLWSKPGQSLLLLRLANLRSRLVKHHEVHAPRANLGTIARRNAYRD